MLVNTFSLLMLFIDSASLVAGFCIIVFTLKFYKKWKNLRGSKVLDNRLEKKINATLLLVTIFLWIRLFSYPLFYVVLQSFVKDFESAMCIHGITQLLPVLCNFLEIIKPIVFFIIGLWLIFHDQTRKSTDNSLILRKLVFLMGVCICVMVNSLGDMIFFINAASHTIATCCTVNIDLPDRISATLSRYLFGKQYEQNLLFFYYLGNLSLIGTAMYFVHKTTKFKTMIHSKKVSGLVFMMSLTNLFLTWLAIKEVFGPKLMNLPHHHCMYCLLQYVPESCFIISLFILGTFGFGWSFGLDIIASGKEASLDLPACTGKLYQFSILCLSLSLALITIRFLL